MKKRKKLWAGFCDGKIAIIPNILGFNSIELFTNRKHAKKFFRDVRPVEIIKFKQAIEGEQLWMKNMHKKWAIIV